MPKRRLPEVKPLVSSLVELLIGGFTGGVLGWAIADNVFDPRFFTYFTFAFGFSFYLFIALAETESLLHRWLIILLLPIYTCMTMFVYVAIVVIIYKNDWVLIRNTIFAGATLTIGEVHTGDWLFHYLPPLLLLVYILFNYSPIAKNNYLVWSSKSTAFKLCYCLYVLVLPALILGCYMITMPFDENYPTKMRTWQICSMVFGLSTAIQLFYLAASYSIGTTLGKILNDFDTASV